VSDHGDAVDRNPDGVGRSAALPSVGSDAASSANGAPAANHHATASVGGLGRHPREGEELKPIAGLSAGRQGELDQLAARLINGELTGGPVSDAVDLGRIERAVREILIALGEDPDRDGLRRTPARVAHAYAELFAGLRVDPAEVLTTTFEECHEEFVLVRDIEVFSLCEHHLLPFHGVAHIGYIPGVDGRITGLSKLARLVEVFSRRPQVQERLTSQVADLLLKALDCRGVIVVLDCEHLCMAMRGIQKTGARTVTSAVRGQLQTDPKTRSEAMSLIMHS